MISVEPLTERALKYSQIWNESGSEWLPAVVHITLPTPTPYVRTYACMYLLNVCMDV